MLQFKQSPINIDTTQTPKLSQTVKFHYSEQRFKVIDNGLNITLLPSDTKCWIYKNQNIYPLSEIHFHRPSEHHVDNSNFDMEVHLVHHARFETVVYSILLTIDDDGYDFGKPFSSIDAWITIDLATLVPEKCWDYHGSLTTSPFDEVVIWLINHQVQSISRVQADLLNNYYPQNNRCLQPRGERKIYTVYTEHN